MKKIIMIILVLFLVGCAGANIPQHKLYNMSLNQYYSFANDEGKIASVLSEYKGYKMMGLSCSDPFVWPSCQDGIAIFAPNGMIVQYIGETGMYNGGINGGGGIYTSEWEIKNIRDKTLREYVNTYSGNASYQEAKSNPTDDELVNAFVLRFKKWESEVDDYEVAAFKWDSDVKQYIQLEDNFLKGLSNEQLEIYIKYEEATKNGSSAKKELYRRKVVKMLNKNQKESLIVLSNLGADLIEREEKLLTQKHRLENEKRELEIERQQLIDYISLQIATSSASSVSAGQVTQPSGWQAFADGLDEMSKNLREKRQMYEINSSLQDIASAIRGY
jgi:hypothetical protein